MFFWAAWVEIITWAKIKQIFLKDEILRTTGIYELPGVNPAKLFSS
jgi:hypothetical protein